MTISILGTTNGIKAETAGTSLSGSVPAGSGSNRLLLVFVIFEVGAGRTVTALTYNDVALSYVDSVDPPDATTTSERIELWVLADPASGSNTLAATFSGSVNDAAFAVVRLQGDDALSVADTAENAAVDVAGLSASLDFGKAGLAVAVVANEIKELARQTAAATEDIRGKIAAVQHSTGSAIGDKFEWMVVPNAIGPGGVGGSDFEVDAYSVTTTSKHPNEAFQWVQYLCSKDSGIQLGLIGGTVGGRPDVYGAEELLKFPFRVVFKDVMDNAMASRVTANWRQDEAETTIQQLTQPLWAGEAQPDEAFLESLRAQIQDIMDKPRP